MQTFTAEVELSTVQTHSKKAMAAVSRRTQVSDRVTIEGSGTMMVYIHANSTALEAIATPK